MTLEAAFWPAHMCRHVHMCRPEGSLQGHVSGATLAVKTFYVGAGMEQKFSYFHGKHFIECGDFNEMPPVVSGI